MKTYLITGAAGFIGSHLIEKLYKEDIKIIAIDNFDDFYSYKIKCKNIVDAVSLHNFKIEETRNETILNLIDKTKNNKFHLYYTDIRNTLDLEKIFSTNKIDVIIHLAALAGVRPSIEKPIEYNEVNITGTLNLWEMAKKYSINKFINASSSSVYGNNEKTPFNENDTVNNPISPYASTKRATEILGHVYHHLYNIDMIHLRFFTVYGPRQRPDLAIHKFTNLIFNNQPIPFYGDGETSRDYTYIDDIIDGIIKSVNYIAEKNKVYEIINLGENEVISLKQMVEILEIEIGIKAKINQLPMQPGDVIKTNADITKAKKMIDYQPKINFSTGISNFIKWYRNEK